MKEEIYSWMKNLAVFYILLTCVIHLLPDRRYERYVRFFMGLLLILMLCSPILSFLGKGGELAESFQGFYQQEDTLRQQQELENLQEIYLERGYERELKEQIWEALTERNIAAADLEIAIKGDRVEAVLYLEEEPDEEEKGRIADGFQEACGLEPGEYQIHIVENGDKAVDHSASSRAAAGGGGDAGFS